MQISLPTFNWHASLLTGVAFCAFLGFAPNTSQASERWETLEAIHSVENPLDLTRPGPCGELGAYQFRERTWRTYTTVPFWKANDRRASDDVAIRHYEWIKSRLERAGIEITPYNIALAWNGGVSAAINGTVSSATRDYAERVSNLAERFRQAQVAAK